MKSVKAYVVDEGRNFLVVFRRGNRTVKTFRYTDEKTGYRRSPVVDPLYWDEDTGERPTIPRIDEGVVLYLDDPVLWDAMQVLKRYLNDRG